MQDKHHCRCFSTDPKNITKFRLQLEKIGFVDEFQEDHGQVFGRILRVADDLQLHIKVMRNGMIEGEMEPPPAYPGAHLNLEHSYSAHREIEQILSTKTTVMYYVERNIPDTCLNPVIKKPHNPTHAKTIVAAGIVGLGLVALADYLSKDDEDDDEDEEV